MEVQPESRSGKSPDSHKQQSYIVEEPKEQAKPDGETTSIDGLLGTIDISDDDATNASDDDSTDETFIANNHSLASRRPHDAAASPSLLAFLLRDIYHSYMPENNEERFSEKRERVYAFMKIPRELEKFLLYGYLHCVEAFLFIFAFLPLRIVGALAALASFPFRLVLSVVVRQKQGRARALHPSQQCDLLKLIVVVGSLHVLSYVDLSIVYHVIKQQSTIKIYILFNMLEVADKLLCSFGQDILDALFWTATESTWRHRYADKPHFGTLANLLLATAYVSTHALLVVFQFTVLSVAFNTAGQSLLVIMMSNNFVEIKGHVFKKFGRSNLYQITCSDARERFLYTLLLVIVALRNVREVGWDWGHLEDLAPGFIGVLLTEVFIDWMKHAFITKFNDIDASVYHDYAVSVAYDMLSVRRDADSFTDQSDHVARKLGFHAIPLAVVLVRVIDATFDGGFARLFSSAASGASGVEWLQFLLVASALFAVVFTAKVFVSILLLGYSLRIVNEYAAAHHIITTPTSQGALTSAKSCGDLGLAVDDDSAERRCASTPSSPQLRRRVARFYVAPKHSIGAYSTASSPASRPRSPLLSA